jgi:3D-(3,5/4)-trihydroxycyclohexane-1,2-dione acylhydrolase (decyclizing)
VVVLDNRGYGCIDRLQQACGGAPFNNMLDDCRLDDCRLDGHLHGSDGVPTIDFAAHARAMGAEAEHVRSIAELEQALRRARAATRTYLIAIDTDHRRITTEGGCWWDVAVPEVSDRADVREARRNYEAARQQKRPGTAASKTRDGKTHD